MAAFTMQCSELSQELKGIFNFPHFLYLDIITSSLIEHCHFIFTVPYITSKFLHMQLKQSCWICQIKIAKQEKKVLYIKASQYDLLSMATLSIGGLLQWFKTAIFSQEQFCTFKLPTSQILSVG